MRPTDRYVVIPLPLLDAPGMALKVYAVLRSYADQESIAWPSRKTIASRAKASVNSVDAALRWLASEGWIAAEARHSADGGQTSNRFRVYGSPRREGAPTDSGRPPTQDSGRPPTQELGNELDPEELDPEELEPSPTARAARATQQALAIPRPSDVVEQVMADYLAWRGGKVARQTMVRLRTQVADALTSGVPEPVVRQGLADWTEHGNGPSSLGSFIDGRARGRVPGQRIPPPSKTKTILAEAERAPDPAIRALFGLPPVTPDGHAVIVADALPAQAFGALP